MKNKLMSIVKNSRIIYLIYYYSITIIINMINMFIKKDNTLILFNCYGGKKYDDSPKEIFLNMINDNRCRDFKYVWAFHNPENFNVPRAKKIKTDTIDYYITALKAAYWVTNSSIERGLNFKKKGTIYFNTWHGTPIKMMGTDIEDKKTLYRSKTKFHEDAILAQSDYEVEIFSRVFQIKESRFLRIGLPRNDVLSNHTVSDILSAKKRLDILDNKKVILYAPTFRNYRNQYAEYNYFKLNMDLWKQKLGEHYILLYRGHYEDQNILYLDKDVQFIYNVTVYPSINDILIATDVLISDYSSIFFDFSILEKPMLCFAYDYEIYCQERGIYLDLQKEIPYGVIFKEEDLVNRILQLDYVESCKLTKQFKQKYIQYYGSATKKCVDSILETAGVRI